MGYLADPSKSLKNIRKDRSLYEAAQFYRDRKKYINSPKYYAKKYPEITLAFDLFINNRAHSWRWYLEALIISGLDNKEIKKTLNVDISIDVLEMYRKLFFDIGSYIDSDIAIFANILSTCRSKLTDCNNYDFTWKLYAFSKGPESFIKEFCSKSTEVSKSFKKWFKEQSEKNITVNAFHLTNDLRLTYNQSALDVLRIAKDFWVISSNDWQKGESLAKESFINELTPHIDMCLYGAKEKLGAVEARANVDYSKLVF